MSALYATPVLAASHRQALPGAANQDPLPYREVGGRRHTAISQGFKDDGGIQPPQAAACTATSSLCVQPPSEKKCRPLFLQTLRPACGTKQYTPRCLPFHTINLIPDCMTLHRKAALTLPSGLRPLLRPPLTSVVLGHPQAPKAQLSSPAQRVHREVVVPIPLGREG